MVEMTVLSFLGQTIFHIFHTKTAVQRSDGDLFIGLCISFRNLPRGHCLQRNNYLVIFHLLSIILYTWFVFYFLTVVSPLNLNEKGRDHQSAVKL